MLSNSRLQFAILLSFIHHSLSSAIPLSPEVSYPEQRVDSEPTWSRCKVEHADASDHLKQTIADLHRRSLDESVLPPIQLRAASTTNVNTYVHIISDISSATVVDLARIVAQIDVMNAVYNPYGINLVLRGTTLTVDNAWSLGAGSDMDAAKRALRQGSYADLNLYFHTNLTGGYIGTCTLPSSLPAGSASTVYGSDGCNIHAGTLPGGSIYGYNKGLTAVHEAGHWFGLLHTFEGDSCTGDGDFIADTRQESISTSGCPVSPTKNSCPDLPGSDPIHNYMDYSIDDCYEAFTPLQAQRMYDLWQTYRQGR